MNTKLAFQGVKLVIVTLLSFSILAAQTTPLTLPQGTPVKLRLEQNLSSADAQEGQGVSFSVLEPIKLGDLVVIPAGASAHGTVTEAQEKRRMGRGGKLNMAIDYVIMPDGSKLVLTGTKNSNGGGHVGAMTAGIVGVAIVAWPAAPLLLLMHGKDVKIPEGTVVTVFTAVDYPTSK